jgi:hypothetical protein
MIYTPMAATFIRSSSSLCLIPLFLFKLLLFFHTFHAKMKRLLFMESCWNYVNYECHLEKCRMLKVFCYMSHLILSSTTFLFACIYRKENTKNSKILKLFTLHRDFLHLYSHLKNIFYTWFLPLLCFFPFHFIIEAKTTWQQIA